MRRFAQIAFTPAVKAAQERMGSRGAYARLERDEDARDALGEDEASFLAERDSFYMATIGASGWPYIQHRGGSRGFVKVLDEHTIAFADVRGNRQYVSVGNVAGDDRVAMIFVDYPRRARLKILARASVSTRADDPALFERVAGGAPAEHIFVLRVEALDWNCPQHITPRFTEEEIRERARATRR
jgi:predicted pyridoxine 5'-phosphate oxidase superfamily flavin-nucleotide-binding protein